MHYKKKVFFHVNFKKSVVDMLVSHEHSMALLQVLCNTPSKHYRFELESTMGLLTTPSHQALNL